MTPVTKIAILGGGIEELSILSEFQRNPKYKITAVYDHDPYAVALEIAEIIGVSSYTDDSFLKAFREADYIIITEKRKDFKREVELLKTNGQKIMNPSEAVSFLANNQKKDKPGKKASWPVHLEQALKYINRVMNRERLLKWLLEIAIKSVNASSGSIMLYSPHAKELYIGYAIGLSKNVVDNTRQRIGDGIAGKVAESRTAQLIEDIIDTPLYGKDRDRWNIQSAISSPVVHNDRLLGVLNVSTNQGEKRLDAEDQQIIVMLAGKVSTILDKHLKTNIEEIRENEFQIRSCLESLFHKDMEFHDKFTYLCKFMTKKLNADTTTIYTATDEGDWLILGGSNQQAPPGPTGPRIHCIKGSLARSYLNGEEIVMTEANHDDDFHPKVGNGAIISIYLPLVHDVTLGVLVFEFSRLDAFDQFLNLKDTLRFQVAFFTYSQLQEIRQTRKVESLELLSRLTPLLIGLETTSSRIEKMPDLLSSLVNADMASVHYEGPDGYTCFYHNFPSDENERDKKIKYDREIYDHISEKWVPDSISYLTEEIDLYERPPMYSSILGYPLFRSNDEKVAFIAYGKIPQTPLDSTIFGKHEIMLLDRAKDILSPIFSKEEGHEEEKQFSFEELLDSNRKLILERIQSEIERAERYHHGFTLTMFRIRGLLDLLESDYQKALSLINMFSVGIKKKVRRTDYFSWIEPDIFCVLSLESYERIGYLEDRLTSFISSCLKKNGLFKPGGFFPDSSFALYPGQSESAADLIEEAKSKL